VRAVTVVEGARFWKVGRGWGRRYA